MVSTIILGYTRPVNALDKGARSQDVNGEVTMGQSERIYTHLQSSHRELFPLKGFGSLLVRANFTLDVY